MSINNNDSKYNALTHWNLPTVIVQQSTVAIFLPFAQQLCRSLGLYISLPTGYQV